MNLRLSRDHAANSTVIRISPGVFLCPGDMQPRLGGIAFTSYQPSRGSGQLPEGLDFPVVINRELLTKVDGFFGGNGPSRVRDITDGLSQTAAFAEQVHGGWVEQRIWTDLPMPSPGFIYEFQVRPPTQRQLLTDCDSLRPAMGMGVTLAGKSWTNTPGYTHLWTPGRTSCFGGNMTNAFSPITASSRHSHGVHTLLADGHVRFVGTSVDEQAWRAMGSRNRSERTNDL